MDISLYKSISLEMLQGYIQKTQQNHLQQILYTRPSQRPFVYHMSQGQQVIILKEGSSESKGREAQRNNIMAAKLISEVVRSSLGPRGMDKMLVDSLGDVTITNDGATMLKEIDVQHP